MGVEVEKSLHVVPAGLHDSQPLCEGFSEVHGSTHGLSCESCDLFTDSEKGGDFVDGFVFAKGAVDVKAKGVGGAKNGERGFSWGELGAF